MAEKEGAKKWLVLLVILVALSLVVDLLSLNVLYEIGKANYAGSLAFLSPTQPKETSPVYDAWMCMDDCWDSNCDGLDESLSGSELDRAEFWCEFDCWDGGCGDLAGGD